MKPSKNNLDLTKSEEQIMQILWKKGPSFVHEVISEFPAPKPAYNTVSTFIRILEKKGFVGHKAFGKSYQYRALISKEAYQEKITGNLLENYFGGSVSNLLSFFAEKEKLSEKEIEELRNIIEQAKK